MAESWCSGPGPDCQKVTESLFCAKVTFLVIPEIPDFPGPG